jgi:hypothetical protein
MSSFFPEEDKYMGNTDYFKPSKIVEGDEVRIRILSQPIVGWENWSEDNKPIRFYPDKKPRVAPNPAKPMKEFNAMLIWNYDLGVLQIWSFGQKNLKASLKSLAQNKGSPLLYDIFVSKHGEGKDTRYILRSSSPSKLDKDIAEVYQETPVNLYALYVGKDPFVDLDAGKEVSRESDVA